MNVSVAEAIARRLSSFQTEYFFILTGGDQPLWIALHDAGIKMVLARSEPSAVYMADGYARASGKPGFTYGQAGPGAANVAAALADPFWALSPVVALTGAAASGATYKIEYQAIDQLPMFEPVTKWNGYAARPERVPELLSTAVVQAMAGNRGPTHLDVPKDFFGQSIEIADEHDRRGDGIFKSAVPYPDPHAVERAAELVLSAKRPVILAGAGVLRASASDALRALAEALALPVVTTIGGKGSIPFDHPLHVGVAGRYSAVIANEVLAESDCVVVVGSRLGGLATNGYKIPQHSAKIVHIDIDPTTFDLNYSADVAIHAHAPLALELLREALQRHTSQPEGEWPRLVRERIEAWRQELEKTAETSATSTPLSPVAVVAKLGEFNSEISVVADTGYMAAWTGVLYPAQRPESFFRAAGSLGWALPASLGVQLARSEKVVCVTGDGGIGYHLADIETAVRLRLPVIIVVMNNQSLAFEYHEQKYRWNDRVIDEVNDFADMDFGAVARATGANGVRVRTLPEFEAAFRKALASDVPTVIDTIVDKELYAPVTNYDGVKKRTL